MDGAFGTEICIGLWWGYVEERDHLENLKIEDRITLKCVLRKCDGKAWNGLIWLRIGKSGGRM